MGLSTGYPTFNESDRQPIDKLGSDSVIRLDGRLSLDSCIDKGFEILEKQSSGCIGFRIIQAYSFREEGRELYRYLKGM